MLTRRNSGKYRLPAKLIGPQRRSDFAGRQPREEIRELWVSVEPKASTERNDGERLNPSNQFTIRTRWTPELIHQGMMIVTPDNREFEVLGIVNVQESNIEFDLDCFRVDDHDHESNLSPVPIVGPTPDQFWILTGGTWDDGGIYLNSEDWED